MMEWLPVIVPGWPHDVMLSMFAVRSCPRLSMGDHAHSLPRTQQRAPRHSPIPASRISTAVGQGFCARYVGYTVITIETHDPKLRQGGKCKFAGLPAWLDMAVRTSAADRSPGGSNATIMVYLTSFSFDPSRRERSSLTRGTLALAGKHRRCRRQFLSQDHRYQPTHAWRSKRGDD